MQEVRRLGVRQWSGDQISEVGGTILVAPVGDENVALNASEALLALAAFRVNNSMEQLDIVDVDRVDGPHVLVGFFTRANEIGSCSESQPATEHLLDLVYAVLSRQPAKGTVPIGRTVLQVEYVLGDDPNALGEGFDGSPGDLVFVVRSPQHMNKPRWRFLQHHGRLGFRRTLASAHEQTSMAFPAAPRASASR